MARALVIGHRGQDGRILWDQLTKRGFSLVGVSRHAVEVHDADECGPAEVVDLASIRRLVERFRPQQVYYLAAHHHSSQDSGANEADTWQDSCRVHVEGFRNVLESVYVSCPEARVFYASSSRVFGDAATSPQDESTPMRPTCIYGVTKVSGMLLADYYRRTRGLFVACGILFNHESPLRGSQFVTQRVVNGLVALKKGLRASFEIGSLDARVDWGYAPDYTRAMSMILEAQRPQDFVVASGRSHSVRDLVATAAQYLGIDWQGRVVETSSILRRDAQELCGDTTRLRETTGWHPSVDFRSMVAILVDGALARSEGRTLTTAVLDELDVGRAGARKT
ncbi:MULTISPECIES: GDP-mannose 4,6-dehydratase [Rhodanobacter]|uniref:GDP-mannose 4,6-dehydratase n=1 Tax=Rhodanobacter TaxID=75309 RepID=UPI000260F822|nr:MULTISPECIES: GDP-mannose 4,6-dehydratase [Rhodanobacter]EIL97158.1 GDP-mannose 4,6-dehydratase [Rhodanobacter thiooxydans LCS2]UJJ59246.1 GDP-mannose 4,6-dehydratase [Rhodanobacter denitrificans]